ncbi:MAG: hypothetical protein ACR2MD_17340 [Aridibacter sp.]
MKNNMINSLRNESGAALVTSLMITVLLGIACIAMLSAVGANSMNSTDVLSETKAYYAAESGLQATINVLRNDSAVDYKYAVANPTLAGKLNYNCTAPDGSGNSVPVGPNACSNTAGTSYKIYITDPDDSASKLTYNTSGLFLSGGTIEGNTIYYPSKTATNRVKIIFNPVASTTYEFTGNNPSLGSFTISNDGTAGAVLPTPTATNRIEFRIDYNLTLSRSYTASIYGFIDYIAPNNMVTFQTQNYKALDSKIKLCSSQTSPCPDTTDVKLNLTTIPTSNPLYATMTPVEPYRLKVISTGYGPNGAKKQLEGIIQKNFFNGLASGAATTMIGTNTTPPGGLPFLFVPGNSTGVTYSGGVCSSPQGCVPSFGLTDPANLAYIENNLPRNGTVNPPPALLDSNNTPDWQQSPAALDSLIDQLRTSAQNSGRYFVSPGGNLQNPGDFNAGTGITFCEGSCKVGGNGGGILVVTGELTNVGGFSFNGMIIVTGEEGWDRTGGGSGSITGNVIIAPYNKRNYVPENLSSTFLAPRYYISGGGASNVIYGDVTANFDNLSSISDFMLGIAEK